MSISPTTTHLYEERVIEGTTMYRTTPNGNWFEVSNGKLTFQIAMLKAALDHAERELDANATVEGATPSTDLLEGEE